MQVLFSTSQAFIKCSCGTDINSGQRLCSYLACDGESQMKQTGNWRTIRVATLAVCVFLRLGLAAWAVRAQTSDTLSGVKRIAVVWPETIKSSGGVRDRVLQKLKGTKSIEIVTEADHPDAILHGKTTIWVTRREYLSPRSKSVEQMTYAGFASMELSG